MACAQETKEPTSIFDCPICLETFKTPVYLPCLHTFCQLCLDTYIDSMVSNASDKNTFNCPVCRSKCDLKVRTSDKWSAQFPFNHLVSTLMSAEEKSPRKLLLDYCDPCQRVGSKVKAASWCCDCNEAYCSDCSESFHKRLRNAHSHTVAPINSDNNVPRYLNMKSEEPCIKHRGRKVEVVCKTHFALCCAVCLIDEHLECKDLKPIDEIISDFSEGKFGVKFIQNLRFLINEIQSIVETKEKQIKEIEDQKEKLIADTENTINDVMAMFTKLKIDVRENVSSEHKLVKRERELQIETLNYVKSNISQSLKLLEVLSAFENPRQSFYLLLKMKPNLSDHLNLFSGPAFNDKYTSFDLNIDPMLLSLSTKNSLSYLVKRNESYSSTKSGSRISVEERLGSLNDCFLNILSNKNLKSDSPASASMLQKGMVINKTMAIRPDIENSEDETDSRSECDPVDSDCLKGSLKSSKSKKKLTLRQQKLEPKRKRKKGRSKLVDDDF